MPEELLDNLNTNITVDGIEVECPECNRLHYLYRIIKKGQEDCKCGATLGPIELTYEDEAPLDD